jgi:mutator protein MutT
VSADLSYIVVTAAIIERDGAFLVTRRPLGVHLEGLWEFPGGKCEPGESQEGCLRREIQEELDTDVRVSEEIFGVTHSYDDRTVELHFLRCEMLGEPRPLLGQEMKWVAREALDQLSFPPADAELIVRLRKGCEGGFKSSGG